MTNTIYMGTYPVWNAKSGEDAWQVKYKKNGEVKYTEKMTEEEARKFVASISLISLKEEEYVR